MRAALQSSLAWRITNGQWTAGRSQQFGRDRKHL